MVKVYTNIDLNDEMQTETTEELCGLKEVLEARILVCENIIKNLKDDMRTINREICKLNKNESE